MIFNQTKDVSAMNKRSINMRKEKHSLLMTSDTGSLYHLVTGKLFINAIHFSGLTDTKLCKIK